MTKQEISKLSEKLIWKENETRLAIRELKKSSSRIDSNSYYYYNSCIWLLVPYLRR